MNLVEEFEQNAIKALSENKKFPAFRAGDTVRVHVKIKEGTTERIQAYEGVCIARSNKSLGANFTVRKISHAIGVERQFPLYSPLIEKIEVVKKGIVRRAKLYYMRNLSGKAARIKEKLEFEPRNKSAAKTKA